MHIRFSMFVKGLWLTIVSTSLAQEVPPPPPTPLEQAPTPLVMPSPAPIMGVPEAVPGPGCAGHGRTIHTEKVYLIEEQSATTKPRLDIREQVSRDVQDSLKIDFLEEKRYVTEIKMMPQEEVEQVVVTKIKEVPSVDCHGHPITTFEKVPCVQTVKVIRYKPCPVTREVIVKVPCLKHVPQPVLVKKLVVNEVEEAAICKKLQQMVVPNSIDLPVCPAPVIVPPVHEAPCTGPDCPHHHPLP